MEWVKKDIIISDDKSKIDIEEVVDFLQNRSYWAKGRNKERIIASIKNSHCYGVYSENRTIGFARVITDYSTFSYLCDLYINENFRGNGYGKILVETIVNDPTVADVKYITLFTKDAHKLYEKYGFDYFENPKKVMKISKKI